MSLQDNLKVPISSNCKHIVLNCFTFSIIITGLVELPPRLFELTDLVDLSLAGNCISYLPEDIRNLRSVCISCFWISTTILLYCKFIFRDWPLKGMRVFHGHFLKFGQLYLSGVWLGVDLRMETRKTCV